MSVIISNKEELRRAIVKFLEGNHSLIAIDGEDGIGKSTKISPIFADLLSAETISVDDFLEKDNKQGYANFIDYSLLIEQINSGLKLGPVILEGVMLLKILEKIKIKPTKFLYVCGEVWFSDWERYRKQKKDFNDIIDEEESRISMVDKALYPKRQDKYKIRSFRGEIFKYTFDYRPMETADEVFVLLSSLC